MQAQGSTSNPGLRPLAARLSDRGAGRQDDGTGHRRQGCTADDACPRRTRVRAPGRQTIRLRFDQPQPLRRIRLVFREAETARTHEFVLRWSADGGQAYRDIVRQQWTFSPPETTHEVEDYRVDLAGATVLELELVPSISGGPARAALAELRLA